MDNHILSIEEKQTLLKLARVAIKRKANNLSSLKIELADYPANLQKIHATFVTITKKGLLRGCIGTLEAYQSLVEDVYEHAVAAAFEDFRFPPVQLKEVNQLKIEVSVLSEPEVLDFNDPIEIVDKIRVGIDGVVINDGVRRATFLPQVWEKVPDPEDFLSQLCYKMGAAPDCWRSNNLRISVYQVDEFSD